jgi:aminoglycoside phosphotransferase (APT) family kinase protein
MPLFQKHVSTNTISQAIKQYAQHEVPHRLCSSTLDPSTIRVVRPQIEKKRSARKALLADQRKVVLRPFTGRGARKKACAYEHLIELLQDNGVPVPRVLFVDASDVTYFKYGFCPVCEEHIDGIAPDEASIDSVLDEVAMVLARMHALSSSTLGAPWHRGHFDASRWFLNRVRGHLKNVRQWLEVSLDQKTSRALLRWFQERIGVLQRDSFQLIHGDLHLGNLILSDDGRIHLVDFGDSSYFYYEADLIDAELRLCLRDENRIARFSQVYFKTSQADTQIRTQDHYHQNKYLFAAWWYLRNAGRCAKKRKYEGKNQPYWEAKRKEGQIWWKELLETIDG